MLGGHGVPRVVDQVLALDVHRVVQVPVTALNRSCVHSYL